MKPTLTPSSRSTCSRACSRSHSAGARSYRAALALLLATTLALPTPNAMAGAQLVSGSGSASVSINVRVVIPPVLRLLENQHPEVVSTAPDGRAYGQQRLVFMSNLKRGACFTFRRPAQAFGSGLPTGDWQVRQTASNLPVSLETIDNGYKLCATRPGRYTVDLEHAFGTANAPLVASLPWPVQTDFNAI